MDAKEIVAGDLEAICRELEVEFGLMEGKKLFVSGGAGFLGYYLIQSVLHWNRKDPERLPVRVTVCDNYFRGVPEWLKVLGRDPNLELIRHDITKPLPDEHGPFDFMIHAASIASPSYYRKYPVQTMDANVHGLRLLLEYALKQQMDGDPVSGFLFFSSSEVYGDPASDQIPTPETYWGNVSSIGPRACYDESKRFGETLCVNFARQYGVPITIARPFNNYGPGLSLNDRRVIPDFARDVLSGNDIVLLSNGTPTRTFCYITDAIAGYYKVLTRGRTGEVYNIGSQAPEISVGELAELVARTAWEQLGYSGKVVKRASEDTDYLTDNPQRRCPCVKKARNELGFAPGVSLEEGVGRTLIWYAGNPSP